MRTFLKEKLNYNLAVTLLVFFLPVLLYVHIIFPKVESFSFLSITIKENGYEDVQGYVYFFFSKVYIISFLSIWYLTIKDWWRSILLLLIIYAFYQLVHIVMNNPEKHFEISVIGLILGILYAFFLLKSTNFFSSSNMKQVNILTFDILKAFLISEKEKEMYFKKTNDFKSQLNLDNNDSSRNILIRKIKNLEANLKLSDSNTFFKKFNSNSRNKFDWIVAISILIAPLVLILFLFIPSGFKYLDLGLFEIPSFGFVDFRIFYYFFSIKLYNFILLIMWFFTCRYLWKYGILANLIVVVFQLATIFSDKITFDKKELFHALPIITPIILIIYFLGRLLKYDDKIMLLNKKIEKQINEIIDVLNLNEQKDIISVNELQALKNRQHTMSEKEYIEQLVKLKNNIEKELSNT